MPSSWLMNTRLSVIFWPLCLSAGAEKQKEKCCKSPETSALTSSGSISWQHVGDSVSCHSFPACPVRWPRAYGTPRHPTSVHPYSCSQPSFPWLPDNIPQGIPSGFVGRLAPGSLSLQTLPPLQLPGIPNSHFVCMWSGLLCSLCSFCRLAPSGFGPQADLSSVLLVILCLLSHQAFQRLLCFDCGPHLGGTVHIPASNHIWSLVRAPTCWCPWFSQGVDPQHLHQSCYLEPRTRSGCRAGG